MLSRSYRGKYPPKLPVTQAQCPLKAAAVDEIVAKLASAELENAFIDWSRDYQYYGKRKPKPKPKRKK